VNLDVENITANSIPKNDVLVTAKRTISAFQKREIGTVYPRQEDLLHVGFDMGEPTGLRIGYAEVIGYEFGLLDT
jgi:hypothetical protein